MKIKTKPISPDDIKGNNIESEIIQAVNELITENFIEDCVAIEINEILKRYFKIRNWLYKYL